jgi:uncharacterized RDD family membrane protein YckC
MNKLKTKPYIRLKVISCLIDYGIIMTVVILFTMNFGEQNLEGEYEIEGLLGIVPVLFWGIMTIGFEVWFGATLGNLIVNLKPISLNGNSKITFSQSFKRHFVDTIDMFMFGLIAYILIKNTENHQRLGDIWAKTYVIKVIK